MVRSTTAPPRGHVRSSALHAVLRQLEVVQVQASAAFWASPGGAEGEQLSTLSTALTTLLATMAEGRKPGMEMRLGGCPEGVGLRIYARPSGKPAPAPSEGLAFHGAAIRDRDQSLSLTDMWKAAGGDPSRKPAHWMRSEVARDFIAFVAENLKVAESQLCIVVAGRGGGTWAHWQVAMAYAKYLSPEFHAWCNEVVRERMQSETRRLP